MANAARMVVEGFEGFADRQGRFFRALARNQTREWFALHRAEYEDGWLAPMKALLSDVRERIDPLFPRLPLAAPKVFRIHRDIRFSRDKSPYKTHVGGYVAVEGVGTTPAAPIAVYVHVSATELFAAAGHYMMDGPQLARFREALLDDARGAAVAGILKRLERAGFTVGSRETLARVPRGFDRDHPRADLLRRKGLTAHFPIPPRELLVSPRFVDWLVAHVRRAVPLVEWLASVGD
jgi:uncharacterized protein (TIGR02453 family)